MHKLFFFLLVIFLFTGFSSRRSQKHQLVISNASVFDVHSGNVSRGNTIVIDDGAITAVLSSNPGIDAEKAIDAGGKLVTPGFMDVVAHLDDVFGDSVNAVQDIPASFELYRKKLNPD